MKKFYTTAAPDGTTLRMFETMAEAVAQATKEVQSGENIRQHNKGLRRYVVGVVAIVEEDRVPIKVTYVTDETPS